MAYGWTSDLARFGLPAEVLRQIPVATQESALEEASQVAEGYFRHRYALPLVWEVLPLVARSTDGEGEAIDIGSTGKLSLGIDVTLVTGSGSPSLAVTLETSEDGEEWEEAGEFFAKTAAGREVARFKNLDRYIRVVWALTGTNPSFTFGARFVGDDLAAAVAKIAAYNLLCNRGFNPEGADENLRKRYEDAMAWLKGVAGGSIDPALIDSTPEVEDGGVVAYSVARRGW